MPTDFIKRGGLWVVGQAVLFVLLVVFCWFWKATLGWPCMSWIGAMFLVVAAGVGIAGAVALGRNLTPFPRPSPGGTLVRAGVYGLMRHPLYTAVFCAAVGWASIWRSWPGLGVALALGVFFDAKARREERWLRAQFCDYAEYARRVCRFVPWVY
jgi:protein-S-isoprenylcysteine O-methyltransferase Ste14